MICSIVNRWNGSYSLMPQICFISPAESDPDATQKLSIVHHEAERCGFSLVQPQFSSEFGSTQLNAFKEILITSEFVLADLSYERPSVYYEIGVAEALDIRCILIGLDRTPIHQTANSHYICYYENIEAYSALVASIISHEFAKTN